MKENQDYKINEKQFGQRVKMIRDKLHLTQVDFLRAISPGQIINDDRGSIVSKWESGLIPKIYTLVNIASLVNTTLDWLVFGKGEPPAIFSNKEINTKKKESTFREICENVAKFFFLANAEIVQENDYVEIKFYKRDLSYFFDLTRSNEPSILENESDNSRNELVSAVSTIDQVNYYILQFCENLAVTRIIDNTQIAHNCNDINNNCRKPIRYFPASHLARNEMEYKINEVLGEYGISFFEITDSPRTTQAKKYLASSLEKLPPIIPKYFFYLEMGERLKNVHRDY